MVRLHGDGRFGGVGYLATSRVLPRESSGHEIVKLKFNLN